MKKARIAIISIILLLTAVFIYFTFSDKKAEFKTIDPEFVSYISAFTSGIISSESTIKIRLAQEYNDAEEGAEVKQNVFLFSPSIKGKAVWIDKRTIEFIPEESLKSGQFYSATFKLGKLIDAPSKFKKFEFNFQVIKQNIEVVFERVKNYEKTELNWQIIEGSIITADVIDIADLSKIFSANIASKKYKLKFENGVRAKIYNFIIDSVPRTEKAAVLNINWNAEDLNINQKGQLVIEIPALGDFKILQTRVYQQPEQYVSVVFSDPLDELQDLTGLAEISGTDDVSINIEDNEIKIYPLSRITGTHTVVITNGITNILGYKTKNTFEIEVLFEDIKPSIELLGKGVIFPTSDGIKFPFRAVNLKAVKVKIIKIYEDNISQFLQINQLDGDREIKRVGRIVYKNTIDLTAQKSIDYGKWNTFALQLDQLIDAEPGAIYRVILSFGMKQSMYPCADADANALEDMEDEENWDEDNTSEYSYWGEYDNYYYYDYDYGESDNPCDKAFYMANNTSVSQNVLASDLGIIAKAGSNNKITVAVTNLTTTKPVSNVEIELYNYQQQLITSGKTNSKGLLELESKNKAFLLIAKKKKQRGYLRLDNASSLSLSKFDVSGKIIQKGIKGFIYGERGVWRPGDTLFLNFMLEDKEMILPQHHPVKFELLNPDGQIVTSVTKNLSVGNIYNFTTKTSADAVTGNWMARVKVGGAVFTKTIRIETIKPNRLKINLDFGKKQLSVSDNNISGKLSVKWLHGAIARNLKANIKLTTKQTNTSFKKYKNFIFDDPSRNFDSEEQTIFDSRLNSNGEAEIKTQININNASPGMLNASFLINVFEEGGDFSVDRFTIPYAPYKTFVGVKLPKGDKARGMLLTDKKHKIDIVTVNSDGKPVNSRVRVDIYKVEWRYWWEKTADNDLAQYIGSSYNKPLSTKIVDTYNGKAQSVLEIKYPDWGRYFVHITDVNSGHSTGKTVYVDWPGWAGRANKDNPGGATMLSFSTDKTDYKVGEEVKVTFPSSAKARALVSIESGSKVIQTYWVETTKESTNFSFKTTPEMSPNVYINITLIQPHNFKENDLPIRLYGIVPINVEDIETRLYPQINMPKEIHPGQKLSIKVSEKQAKAMEYTIAIVDEGLLDITRFKTPNPWNVFYAREALGVRTWDMYDYVMGAFSGKISGLLQIGGDGLINKNAGNKANRFKPVIKFLGPFTLKKSKTNIHTFVMPQYVGSVRTMLIASHKNAYGIAQETTPVKQPLMVLATLPRVVGPTEQVKLPITVFAMDKTIKNVSVEVKTNNYLFVSGSKKKQIKFTKTGDKIITFNLNVAKKVGVAKLEIIAKSGSNTARYNIELDVRNPNPPTTNIIEKVIEPEQSWQTNFAISGIQGTNSAYLEISNIPSINIENRLKYLLAYPHGCVEQTTSAVFPQLFLSDVMELKPAEKLKTKENIQAALTKLISFQSSDGGFTYWPGYQNTDDWASSYVCHFLISAKNKGYVLPVGMLNKLLSFQTKKANLWKQMPKNSPYFYQKSDILQAYRLYTLALANKPQIGAMNRLKEKMDLSLQAKWRLAAAYVLAGQKAIAKSLVFSLNYNIPDYTEMAYSYGSSTRDKAMILETMILLGEKEKSAELLKVLSKKMNSENWMSTQTTAYSLIAVSEYIAGNTLSDNIDFSFKLNNNKEQKIISTKVISTQALNSLKPNNSIKIINNNKSVLFAKIITRGIPVVGSELSKENDLLMTVKYYNLEGKELNPKLLFQGTDFKVEVTIKNPGYKGKYKQLALTQIFPSGWEIHNIRMDEVGSVHTKSTADYMNIRDDRVYYYFDLNEGETKTFVTLLNSSYLGRFYLPSVYCEAMYDNTINASKQAYWVEVIK